MLRVVLEIISAFIRLSKSLRLVTVSVSQSENLNKNLNVFSDWLIATSLCDCETLGNTVYVGHSMPMCP